MPVERDGDRLIAVRHVQFAEALSRERIDEAGEVVRPMNGRSELVASRDGRVFAVVVPDGVVRAVDHLWVVADPEKLGRWGEPR